MNRHARRAFLACTAGLTVVGLMAGPALAHVVVAPSEAPQGSFSELTFRVPTESDTASTVKVEVALPTETPLTFVLTEPIPGWTVSVTTTKVPDPEDSSKQIDVPGVITWTADSAAMAIKPGQYLDMPILAGPLPDVESLEFKAVQTYSDGDVVRWIEPMNPDGSEPELPAPVLKLTPGDAGTSPSPSASGGSVAPSSSPPVQAAPIASTSSESNAGVVLGVIGIIVGVIGIGLAAFALTRGRSGRSGLSG